MKILSVVERLVVLLLVAAIVLALGKATVDQLAAMCVPVQHLTVAEMQEAVVLDALRGER